jgi:hypothetical protein
MLPYADLLLHLTEWHQFSNIDPKRLATRTASPKVIDARGTPRRRPVARSRLDVPVSRPCLTNTPMREGPALTGRVRDTAGSTRARRHGPVMRLPLRCVSGIAQRRLAPPVMSVL